MSRIHLPTRLVLLAISMAILTLVSAVAARDASAYTVTGVSEWKADAAPMAWDTANDRVYYNAANANGLFNGYSAAPDGSAVTCLTCAAPVLPKAGTDSQRGVSDVSPDGRYLLLTVENDSHLGATGGQSSEPGKGYANDLYLASADGSQMWPLTSGAGIRLGDLDNSNLGAIWARFDHTGNRIVWSQMTALPSLAEGLGQWELKTATISWTDGTPSLTDITTIPLPSGHFYEPYGFNADNSQVIFASDIDQPAWYDSQIDQVALDGSDLTQLSPINPPGFFTNYNEFAFPIPNTDSLIYGSTVGATGDGIDYWTMNNDGSDPARLTFFNQSTSSMYLGYSVVGGLAFDPCNPDHLLASVATDAQAQTINTYSITLTGVPQSRSLPASCPQPAPTTSPAPSPTPAPPVTSVPTPVGTTSAPPKPPVTRHSSRAGLRLSQLHARRLRSRAQQQLVFSARLTQPATLTASLVRAVGPDRHVLARRSWQARGGKHQHQLPHHWLTLIAHNHALRLYCSARSGHQRLPARRVPISLR